MDPELESFVRQVWQGRHEVELAASTRFAALAERLDGVGAPRAVVSLAERASGDELRHAAHCQTLVSGYGGPRLPSGAPLVEYAPAHLGAGWRLLYEVVAQCCIAETESMSTLLVLNDAAETPELKRILHELARDEVNHSRIGWGYLAWARHRYDLGDLGRFLPGMLEGNASTGVFTPVRAVEDGPTLLRHGVVPASMRRTLYVETLQSVVFPGLEEQGVNVTAARGWLEGKLAD